MDAPIDHGVTKRLVCGLRDPVVDQRIGSHFDAPLGPGPLFRGREQPFSGPLPAMLRAHKPALDLTNGLGVVATVGMRAQAHFEEADEGAIGRFGDEKRGGEL